MNRSTAITVFIAAIAITLFFNIYNNLPLRELITRPTFYRDLFLGLIIAFFCIAIILKITQRLDEQYHWREQTIPRVLLQIGFGIVIPSGIIILYHAVLYHTLVPDHVIGTMEYWNVEFPVTVIFLFLTNTIIIFIKELASSTSSSIEKSANAETLIGLKENQKFILSHDEIAWIHLDYEVAKIMKSTGEVYIGQHTLSTYMEQFDPTRFFRANRQNIIHRQSIKSYKSAEHGKMSIALELPNNPEVMVSQKSAANFRRWIKRNQMIRKR